MPFAGCVAPDERGGRPAQVLEPWNRWLASFGALGTAVRSSWGGDTAWIDDWDPENPARGQCGTSALVLQDERGGEVVRGLVHETGTSAMPTVHYWNVFDDRHVDLTWQQFSASAFVLGSEPVRRDALLVSSWFTSRYTELRHRLDARLAAHSDGAAVRAASPTRAHVPAISSDCAGAG